MNGMKSKVTMQDIADRLNLSKNSVSQALTGKSGVSETTRQLIIETAEQMGYVYGKEKKRRQPDAPGGGSIALIASDFAFSQKNFFGGIYLSIEKEVRERGYDLLIQSVNKAQAAALDLPPFVENRSVAGVLALSHITTDYIKAVIDTGIPTVLIDHHHPDIAADSVLTNNRFGAYEAVRHLIQLGHRSIGYIGDIGFSPSYYERLDGYRLALHEHGLEADNRFIFDRAQEDSSYINNLVQQLDSYPTAWFCVNDGLGFMLNSALQQIGLRVPEDASVVSFDNGYLSRIATPAITTVNVDLELFGCYAVERLMERMADPDKPLTETLLPTNLIVRESSASPKV